MFGLLNFVYDNVNLYSFLIALVALIILGYLLNGRELPGLPPGPSYTPILGNLLDMRGTDFQNRHFYFDELNKKYGPIHRIYFGRQLMIILCDVEAVSDAFVKQKDLFSRRPAEKLWDVKMALKDGAGIIWSNDQHWKSVRRMALQALRDLGVGKSTLEDRILDETNFVLGVFAESENQPIRVHDILMKAGSNIISSVVFGSRFEYDDPEFNRLLSFMKICFQGEGPFTPLNVIPQLRFLPFVASQLNKVANVFEHIRAFITNQISDHQKTLNKDQLRDFIDIGITSMEDPESTTLTRPVLMATIIDLFLAGSDTTSNTLDWAFLYMILNPHIQEKCQKEIDNVVGYGRRVKWEDRSKMPYIEATLLEVQRVSTIVPVTLPHTSNQDTMIKGYVIPKGSLVFANIRACHMDEKVWNEPEQFRPERFLDENGEVIKNNYFIPFSVGPRACPGASLAKMEMFLIFCNILQRYTLSKADESDISLEGRMGITVSTSPYNLRVTARTY